MKTIKCPHCNKQSYGIAYCDHCGEEIPRNTNPQPEQKEKNFPKLNIPKPNINETINKFSQNKSEPVYQQPINQVNQAQPIQQQFQQPIYNQPQMGGIMCPRCKQRNVSVQMVQTSAKSKHNSRGCLWELMRLFLIFFTCGLWLIVGKSLGKSKTKFKNSKICVCQSCGHSWNI